ncbi:AhpC/TSA family protein [Geodermatophilus ruber]|uniref:AhpC/TSA family protein n=1 Tax=Geodermatophilus ruber TaxID=504800 RepID=A0A1I4I5J8_9ACTN|nr:AhpC/TSA family protein [Geodermatophilus ruber]
MGRRAPEFRALGAEVLAVGVTATFSQTAFAASLGIDVPLLSDWDRTVCAAYGVRYDVWKGHTGVAKRSVFVIDRDRTVRYRWVTDDALVLPDLDEVVRAVAGLPAGAG